MTKGGAGAFYTLYFLGWFFLSSWFLGRYMHIPFISRGLTGVNRPAFQCPYKDRDRSGLRLSVSLTATQLPRSGLDGKRLGDGCFSLGPLACWTGSTHYLSAHERAWGHRQSRSTTWISRFHFSPSLLRSAVYSLQALSRRAYHAGSCSSLALDFCRFAFRF